MVFVKDIRMQRAGDLLESTTMSIVEVAARVRFSSRSRFAQSFKKHAGLTPHDFREGIGDVA